VVAADTNVIVRFLTRDDSAQAARAASLLSSRLVWISKTVLLETAWVLRSLYGFGVIEVNEALKGFAGLSNVRVEDAMAVASAFEWTAMGIDFADALHLASSAGTNRFLTFDRRFVRRAKKLTGVRVAALYLPLP
jgi:predicted nucleic-acid-binding protein